MCSGVGLRRVHDKQVGRQGSSFARQSGNSETALDVQREANYDENSGVSDGEADWVQLQAASPVQVKGFVHVSCQDGSDL